MAETEAPQQIENETTTEKTSINVSFTIWPPTERTREAVTKRLIDTLINSSVLSRKYGKFPKKSEATDLAKAIEEKAHAFAIASASEDTDSIETLQVYSKEISKDMLELVKTRFEENAAAAPAPVPKKEKKKRERKVPEKQVEKEVTADAPKTEE